MNSKCRITIFTGVCFALGGATLAYKTNYSSSLIDLFQTIGLMILCFGLLLILLAFHTWLQDSRS